MRADGIVGRHTWSELLVRVQRSDRGSAVRAVQIRLQANEEYHGAVDGIFGPRTAGALRSFQRHERLRADGITDRATWRSLLTHGRNMESP